MYDYIDIETDHWTHQNPPTTHSPNPEPPSRPYNLDSERQRRTSSTQQERSHSKSNYSARRKAQITQQKTVIFLGACCLTVSIIGAFAWFQSLQTPATPEFDKNLSSELDKRKEYLQEVFNLDYKPNPIGSNSVGYLQKLSLNVATKERMLAQDRLITAGNACNNSRGTVQTCLLRRLTETTFPLKLRAMAGERFALVSLDKKIKLTKSGKLDPKSAETPDYPSMTLAYLAIWEAAIDSGNYEIAYNNSTDPIKVQEAFATLLDARRTRLIGEKRTDTAQELKNLEEQQNRERSQWQSDQNLKTKP